MKKVLALWLVLIFAGFTAVFAVDYDGLGFPYMGFVFQSIQVPYEDQSKVEIVSNHRNYLELNYKGTNYKATLFTYGAIYLKRQGRNPVLISFDVKEFRMGARLRY